MSCLCQIVRTRDGMELAELSSAGTIDLSDYRKQARQLIERLRVQRAGFNEKNKLNVDSDLGPYYYL